MRRIDDRCERPQHEIDEPRFYFTVLIKKCSPEAASGFYFAHSDIQCRSDTKIASVFDKFKIIFHSTGAEAFQALCSRTIVDYNNAVDLGSEGGNIPEISGEGLYETMTAQTELLGNFGPQGAPDLGYNRKPSPEIL